MPENSLIHILGMTLLHSLWQGAAVALVFWLGRLVMRQQGPNGRYFWALSALATATLLPVATFFWLWSNANHGAPGDVTAATETATAISAGAVAQGEPHHLLTHILPWLVLAWVAGVVWSAFRILLGWLHLNDLRRQACHDLPPGMQETLESLCQQFRTGQSVGLAICRQVVSPLLIGVFRPIILIPPSLLTGLSPEQMRMVLAHELAHLKRHDHLVNLYQLVVETLYFYHPAVRWLSHHLRVERELACDDLAVSLTGDGATYAETLLSLEKQRMGRPGLALSMKDADIVGRVRRLAERKPGAEQGMVGLGTALLSMTLAAVGFTVNQLSPEPAEELLEVSEPLITLEEDGPDTPVPEEISIQESAQTPSHLPRLASLHRESAAGWQSLDDLDDLEGLEAAPESPDDSASAPTVNETPEPEPMANDSATELAEAMTEEDETTASLPSEPETGVASAQAAPDAEPPSREDGNRRALVDRELDLAATRSAHQNAELTLAQARTQEPIEQPPPHDRRQDLPPTINGGQVVEKVEPYYPRQARMRNLEGSVEVEFTVDRNGSVRDIEILQEEPHGFGFGSQTIRALEEWRFQPFKRGGERIEYRVRTGFDFDSPHDCKQRTGSRLPIC